MIEQWMLEAETKADPLQYFVDRVAAAERQVCIELVKEQAKLWADERVGYALADVIDALTERRKK